MRARVMLVVGNNCSLCALDFCICSSCSLLFPPISLQFRVQCSSSIVLCMETQSRDYAALPSAPWSFFFSLLCDNVSWQRPWRHRRPNEPPSSASFSRITFGIGRESWGVAWGIRCARTEKEEKGPVEWYQLQWVDVTEWTANVRWLGVCVLLPDWGTAKGGEMDVSQSSGIGCFGRRWCQWMLETLIDFFWIHVWR